MSTGADPTSVYKFGVEIEGILSGWFTECSGLNIERKIETYQEGGVNDYVHKLPGQIELSNVTLKRGLIGEELWQWFHKGLYDAMVERHNVTISLYSNDRCQVKRWNLRQAYPIKWQGPDFKVDSTQVAVETVEFVHHGMEVTGWTPA